MPFSASRSGWICCADKSQHSFRQAARHGINNITRAFATRPTTAGQKPHSIIGLDPSAPHSGGGDADAPPHWNYFGNALKGSCNQITHFARAVAHLARGE